MTQKTSAICLIGSTIENISARILLDNPGMRALPRWAISERLSVVETQCLSLSQLSKVSGFGLLSRCTPYRAEGRSHCCHHQLEDGEEVGFVEYVQGHYK